MSGINFKPDLLAKVLDGTKTQTRRRKFLTWWETAYGTGALHETVWAVTFELMAPEGEQH